MVDTVSAADAHLSLLVDHDRNRELLADWLAQSYDVDAEATALDESTDLCLVDEPGFARFRDRLREWKERTRPVFSPVVLLSEEPPSESFDPDAWQTIDGIHIIDDIVTVPIEQAVLQRRLSNLLERRHLSQELDGQYRRSEARFTSLFHATPDPALVVGEDGTVRFVNDAFCATAGCERAGVVGDRLSDVDVFSEAAVSTLRDAAVETLAGDWPGTTEVTYTAADGSRRWAELNAGALTVDDVRGAVLVLRDVTERRQRERELQQSERRFTQIAEHVHEVIWMVDPGSGDLLYISPGIEDVLGLSPEALGDDYRERFFEQIHEDDVDRIRSWMETMLSDVRAGAADAPYTTTYRLRAEDGIRWVELDGYPVFGDDGEVERLVGLLDDITDKKQREANLEAHNERLEEFASIVSHDLRNPLQVIQSRIDLVDTDDEHVTSIAHAADRMNDLIDDLLSLAQRDAELQDVQALSIERVVTDAWALVATDEATLEASVSGRLEADPTQLQQLFENLFRNSIEHTGSAVTVRVGDIDDGSRRGFYVEDDGPGIPEDGRDQVFGMGYTTTDDGTGFGLSIVREVVDAHGWDVAVTESEDGGARFEVTGVEYSAFGR